MKQAIRLDRRTKFQNRVFKVEPSGIGNIQIGRLQDREWFTLWIEKTFWPVHQDDIMLQIGMKLPRRLHQRPGMRHVVFGNDGADSPPSRHRKSLRRGEHRFRCELSPIQWLFPKKLHGF